MLKTTLIFLLFQSSCIFATAEFSIDSKAEADFEKLLTFQPIGFRHAAGWDAADFLSANVDLTLITNSVKARDTFSSMYKGHMKGVLEMKSALLAQPSIDSFLLFGEILRDHEEINKKAWLHALFLARGESKELQRLRVTPSLPELVPDIMFARVDLERAIEQALSGNGKECVVSDGTVGADNGIENTLWYFRQDVFANANHYFWHIYHSTETRQDRRGELFYFMHHEFVARYATERINNKLPKVVPLPVVEGLEMIGYNSHLTDANSGSNYAPRVDGAPLVDSVPAFAFVEEQARYRQEILSAIEAGYLVHSNGSLIALDNTDGVDYLGDAIEAYHSINPELYGTGFGYHGLVHFLIAVAMDPDLERPNEIGVMVNPSTSMRDIIFYNWHQAVENDLQTHKLSLEPYSPTGSDFPLEWRNVRISGLEVSQTNGELPTNELQTHWGLQTFNLTRGLDWLMNETLELPPVEICSTHLDHSEFAYKLTLENVGEVPQTATIRIFLAPRFDEDGSRFSMEEQHQLFFALDRFTAELGPGLNEIPRSSLNSALTIPGRAWLENLNSTENYCGCGWPNHLLLPKGTDDGAWFDLFAMVTEGTEDAELLNQRTEEDTCATAPIWCGFLGQKYPDSKPIGYPFDRKPYSLETGIVGNLDEYVANIPNMMAVQIKISHVD